MSRIKRAAIAALVGTSMIGATLAQVSKKQAAAYRELFQELDANNDGAIERDEVPASGRAAFDRLLKRGDDNHDGKLEAAEYRGILIDLRDFATEARKKAGARFKAMDKDGDGKLSRDEFRGAKARFDAFDRDGDGFLTRQELLPGATPVKAAKKAKAKAKKTAKKPGAVKKTD